MSLFKSTALLALSLMLSGCAVIAVADAAVSVAAVAVKTTVKVGAAAVQLAIPDGESDDDKTNSATRE